MNRHLKRIKELTRQIDAAVEDDVANAAHSAYTIMRGFQMAGLVERVEADLLGQTSFNLREFINYTMGQKLGRFIASTIDFSSVARSPRESELLRMAPSGTVEFRAEVFVLTREQFKKALEDAYRAGR